MSLVIFIVVIIVLILSQVFSVKIKGVIGEKTTSSILYFLDKSKYKVINNIVLEAAGKSTQIDHIVISDFGVFVIQNIGPRLFINERKSFTTQYDKI
jgi:hypothetical protein